MRHEFADRPCITFVSKTQAQLRTVLWGDGADQAQRIRTTGSLDPICACPICFVVRVHVLMHTPSERAQVPCMHVVRGTLVLIHWLNGAHFPSFHQESLAAHRKSNVVKR
jgi:hypothetical protein